MAATRSALHEGYILGDYRIERVLGAGGFGITYLARDAALKRLFAIKEYCPHDLSKREGTTVYPYTDVRDDYERGLNDFIKEAQTLARFHHRNIVGVARIFETNNTAYMVLNFEEGSSLKEWLKNRETKPDQQEIDAIAGPLLEALELIHADNTLHRDIAPDNIYIRKDGSPVLLDFGSARQALTMRSRSVSAIVKAGYSPQEQYSTRAANQGPWTDIYALSATLYRMLIGETPPEASDRTIDDHYEPLTNRKLKGYRPTLLAAIDWGLALRPKDRPQAVAEWRGPLLQNKPVPAGAVKLPGSAGGQSATPKSKMPAIAAAALVAVLGIGAGIYALRDDGGASTDNPPATTEQPQAVTQAPDNAVATAPASEAPNASPEASPPSAGSAETTEPAAATTDADEAQKKKLAEAEAANGAGQAREAAGPVVEFSGLELGPVGADGSQLVRSISAQSLFNGKVRPSETLIALKHNGETIDLADPQKAAGATRRLVACDTLVADVGAGGQTRSEQVRLPQDFGFLAGAPKTPIVALDTVVAATISGGPRIDSLGAASMLGKAGLAPGDVITSFGGTRVGSPRALDAEAGKAAAAGGAFPVEYLRDCAEKTATVSFEQNEATVEWAGLTLTGNASGPAVVKTIAQGSIFDTKLLAGDEISDLTVGGANTLVEHLSDVREKLVPLELCGSLQVRYRRAGNPGSIIAPAPLPSRKGPVELAALGIKGWLLADDRGIEIGSIDAARRPGWDPGLKAGDLVERLGSTQAAALGSLDENGQLAFLGSGGQIAVRRGCEQVALAVPPYVIARDEPIDLATLSSTDRGAVLSALYHLGHYRSPYASREFVEAGALDFQTRTAISAFKKAAGKPEDESLLSSDIALLVPQGGSGLPGDREVATLSSIIPPDIAANSARYIRRIDLFLRSKGYTGNGQRAELARYLASQGVADSDGYITDPAAARAIFVDTLDVNVSGNGEQTFGKWTFRANPQSSTCEIYARPSQIQGLLFDFFLQGTAADSPKIVLGVTRGQASNAMTMNFGGFDGYAAADVPTVLTSTGKAFQVSRNGNAFVPASSDGSISTELHKALDGGDWLDIIGASKHGGGLRIRYPAEGFRQAFMHMRSECGVNAIADWLN